MYCKLLGKKVLHLRKLRTKIRSQLLDDAGSPPLTYLLGEDFIPDIPVQLDQLSINSPLHPELGITNSTLQSIKRRGVTIG